MKKMLGLLALALLVALPGCGCCKSKKKEDRRAKTTKRAPRKNAKTLIGADENRGTRAHGARGEKRGHSRNLLIDAE